MTQAPDPRDAQLRSLANLLLLESRLRQAATIAELGFSLVNDIRLIVSTDIALLWRNTGAGGRVESVSGLPEPAHGAPFTAFVESLCRHLRNGGDPCAPRRVELSALSVELAESAREFLPAEILWAPLDGRGNPLGSLLVARATPWTDEEIRIVGRIAEAAAHVFLVLAAAGRWRLRRPFRSRRWAIGALAAALLVLLLPVRLSVLAPAEVVPRDPLVLRAPLDGVISKVLVKPNQEVKTGDPLFRLDDRALRTKLAMAQQELEVTQAEYRQAQQSTGHDPQASARLPVLAAQIVQKIAEVDYEQALLARIDVRAPADGVIILSDVNRLEGKPVTLGERIMTLANPKTVLLEAWLPIHDNIPLQRGAPIDLFLNTDPGAPLAATLDDMDFQAQHTPEGPLAYRATAGFTETTPPRIGLRGTARVFGRKVSLFYYLFRRPWAAARPWLQW
ncbi:efflux RND transporter periplasmic adaptor subunit [Oleispirillum naphthae]|uniref:efflux RND transporter periplasmic adaptor subunit n=1 Tax=Oleispirillum naphthae TaxID=2838853 RepID=UPI0030826627